MKNINAVFEDEEHTQLTVVKEWLGSKTNKGTMSWREFMLYVGEVIEKDMKKEIKTQRKYKK